MNSQTILAIVVALMVALAVAVAASGTTDKSYFGVDPTDEEAVRRRQNELNDEKMRELFGDNHHELTFHDGAPETSNKKPLNLLEAFHDLFMKVVMKIDKHNKTPASDSKQPETTGTTEMPQQ